MIAVIKDVDLPVLIASIATATTVIIRAFRQETRPRENGKRNGKKAGESIATIERQVSEVVAKLDGHLSDRQAHERRSE